MKRLMNITTQLIRDLLEAGKLDASENSKRHRPPNCLLVEDDEADANLAIDALSKVNCVPVVARSGEEAMELLNQSKDPEIPNFEIVFLDLSLLGVAHGLDVLKHIRKYFPSIHTVLVSGHIDESVMNLVNHYDGQGGYVGVVKKPLRTTSVNEIFKKHNIPTPE